jgi:phosphoglycerate dehydrogenase-like enzyme
MRRLAILDDYARFALTAADWSAVTRECEISVFDRHLEEDEAVTVLEDFEILCTLRERMAFPRTLIERLPNLRLIAATGARHHRSMDVDAATARGVLCCYTTAQGNGVNAAAEHAFALILALARHLPKDVSDMRHGGWQRRVGIALYGRTLGLLGLGRIAQAMCPVAKAFGMDVIAWSQNLTPERATAHGARLVTKDALFRDSDVLSINVMLSERTHDLVRARELGLMKPTAFLVNTARGPIVNEDDLVDALSRRRIAGAALDVFDREPLPDEHRLRRLENCILTPHMGYNVAELLTAFYTETIENVAMYLKGTPIRLLNPDVLRAPGGQES